jgi:hypothetical protein
MKLNKALLVSMARLLYPKEPVLTREGMVIVEEDVMRYLTGQILAMPAYLKVPYVLALHGFNCLSLFRFGLPFTHMRRSQQLRYIRFWSASPIGLMRDFIKLIRSCVLLSYLDHPLVLKEMESAIDDVSEKARS